VNLHRLHIFRVVVEQQSFSLAAEKLLLTQPSVSMQVRALERELGVALLYRQGRRMLPTEIGAVVYEYACTLLTEAEELTRAVREWRGARAGHIAIGASTSALYRLLPVLARFQHDRPGAHLQVRAAVAGEICDLILRGELDAGLVVAPHLPPGLVIELTLTEELVAVAVPTHPLCRQPRVSLAELGATAIILPPPGTGLRPLLDAQLLAFGLPAYRATLEVNSIEGIKLAVENGMGVAFLPRCAVAAELASGRLRALAIPGIALHAEMHLVRRPRRHLSPLMAELLRYLQQTLT